MNDCNSCIKIQATGSESSDKDWLELPLDVMTNILSRIDVRERLENAKKVCTTWRRVIKDPAMWRVIKMDCLHCPCVGSKVKMYMHAVDLSEGQLVDVSIIDFNTNELLLYIAERASQLKRLHVACRFYEYHCSLETLKKFPRLEELSLYLPNFSREIIEVVACYCPKLKTLELHCSIDYWACIDDGIAKAIGEKLPNLQHLSFIYCSISNIGLEVILDGCCHLESLDLRQCWNINIKGDLGKRCLEQIKYLRLPYDSLKDCPYILEFQKSYDGYDEFVASIGGLHFLIDFNSMNEFVTAYYDDDFEE